MDGNVCNYCFWTGGFEDLSFGDGDVDGIVLGEEFGGGGLGSMSCSFVLLESGS